MNSISVSMDFLLEEGIDEETTYVVVDTYKFSTTVVSALSQDKLDRVYCEPSVEDLEKYRNDDGFLAGGEMTNGVDEPIGNSPSLIQRIDFPTNKIALTSDNGARRVYQLVENGAEDIVLGSLVNAGAVSEYLDDKENWTVIPADAGETPRFEDYIGSTLISNLANGLEKTERVFQEYERRVNDAVVGERFEWKDEEDWNVCTDVGSLPLVPKWNSDGYFERFY